MRLRARIDTNHKEIVDALRSAGCSVQSLAQIGKGCPDLLVGRAGRNWLLEVKAGRAKLTDDEWRWHAAWRGETATVRTLSDALAVVGITITGRAERPDTVAWHTGGVAGTRPAPGAERP
jgi:hypothetical protein